MTTLLTRRFTVKDYHRMLEAGILTDDDRVELIRGEIIQMSPISPRYAGHVKRLPTVEGYLFCAKILPGSAGIAPGIPRGDDFGG